MAPTEHAERGMAPAEHEEGERALAEHGERALAEHEDGETALAEHEEEEEGALEEGEDEVDTAPIQGFAGAECRLTVKTAPDQVAVRFRGNKVGMTPLEEAPVPCGEGRLELSRPRWVSQTLTLNVQPGETAQVQERLRRPTVKLRLVSSPAGATFYLGRRKLGTSPVVAEVPAYTRHSLRASLPGHKAWSRKVYLKPGRETVRAELEPAKKTFRLPIKRNR